MNWTKEYLRRFGPQKSAPGLSMNDRVEPTGHLSIKVIDAKTQEIVQQIEKHNLVVNGGRTALSRLFGGYDVANRKIAQMTFGDGVTAPAVTDTALAGTVIITVNTPGSGITTHFDGPLFPGGSPDTKVQFVGTVGVDDGNGSGSQNYTEAGLLTGDATLATRTVFGLITKTNQLVVVGTWTITF